MEKISLSLLRQARRNQRFTLRQVANLLGISQSSMWKYENGSIRIGADELSAFACLYGVSCEQFFVVPIKNS